MQNYNKFLIYANFLYFGPKICIYAKKAVPLSPEMRKSIIIGMLLCATVLCAQEQLTNLPTVYIETENSQEPYDKIHEIRCFIRIADGTSVLEDSALVRLRGNASKGYPKKPYHIRFDKKHSVVGSPAKARRWTLINNWGDKTLMRNLLAFELSRRLEMPYTPFGRAVDVVMNGDYKGCYQLCDQIHVHKDRVEVDEGGFLIEADAYAEDEDVYFYSNNWTPVSIHYPKSDSITTVQINAIKKVFNKMEQNSHSNMDRETFLRHFLVGEISGNTDTYWSTYFYKNSTSDTVFTGPVWDFDLAFENDDRTQPICSHSQYIYRCCGSCAGDMRNFVNTFINNSTNKKRLKTLYAAYRDNGALSAEAMIAVVDSLEAEIQASAALNFERWPILSEYVHQNFRVGHTYAQEVEWVREYLTERFAWMDNKLNYVPGQALEQVSDEDRPRKELRNGQIVILRGGNVYSINGQKLE